MTLFQWLSLTIALVAFFYLIALVWRFAKEWLLWPDVAIDPRHFEADK